MKNGSTQELALTVSGPVVLEAWPSVDNPDTVSDDVQNRVTAISVAGVPVVPAFAYGTFTYTADIADPSTVAKSDVVVSGPDTGDVKITKAGNVFTISVPSAPGDPVYTVTVS
jgi:hypothetical protein